MKLLKMYFHKLKLTNLTRKVNNMGFKTMRGKKLQAGDSPDCDCYTVDSNYSYYAFLDNSGNWIELRNPKTFAIHSIV